MTQEALNVAAFLDGSAPLDGVWFGDRHPTLAGAFWWRPRVKAALSAPAAPGWMPMHSAPRDGNAILALLEGSDIAYPVRWLPADNKYDVAGWYMTWDLAPIAACDGPLHWMPLPAAPKEPQP